MAVFRHIISVVHFHSTTKLSQPQPTHHVGDSTLIFSISASLLITTKFLKLPSMVWVIIFLVALVLATASAVVLCTTTPDYVYEPVPRHEVTKVVYVYN